MAKNPKFTAKNEENLDKTNKDEIVGYAYLLRDFNPKQNLNTGRENFSFETSTANEKLFQAKARLNTISATSLGCDLLLKFYVKSIMDRGFLACRNCRWILSQKKFSQKINRVN